MPGVLHVVRQCGVVVREHEPVVLSTRVLEYHFRSEVGKNFRLVPSRMLLQRFHYEMNGWFKERTLCTLRNRWW